MHSFRDFTCFQHNNTIFKTFPNFPKGLNTYVKWFLFIYIINTNLHVVSIYFLHHDRFACYHDCTFPPEKECSRCCLYSHSAAKPFILLTAVIKALVRFVPGRINTNSSSCIGYRIRIHAYLARFCLLYSVKQSLFWQIFICSFLTMDIHLFIFRVLFGYIN